MLSILISTPYRGSKFACVLRTASRVDVETEMTYGETLQVVETGSTCGQANDHTDIMLSSEYK